MSAERILVVDDNPTNLKLISDLLAFEGYEILQAIDAEQAQEIVRQTPPILILMDIALPGMDGLALTRLLKADEKTRSIIIIALTAFAMKGDDQKAFDAGCDGYITKPIDTRQLPGQVAAYLPAAVPVETKSRIRILIIEDHAPQMKLASHILSSDGHQVSCIGDAEQAFAAIRKEKPEVILLDLVLPAMDGLTLARRLKANPETRDIPIVAVTGFPERFPKADALAAGCDAYFLKPINTRELPVQLTDAVKRGSQTLSL